MTARRVGVNLAWLVPGVVGGSEEATTVAVAAAGDVVAAAGIEIVLFGLPALRDAHPGLVGRFEFHEVAVDGANKVRRVLAENTALARTAAAAGLDLMHHAGGVVPPGVKVPATLAVHDTQPLDLPANFSLAKRLYLGRMIGRSVHRALAVAVPSAFVKSRVVAHTGVSPDRVTVVPWAAPAMPAPSPADVDAVRSRYGLERPFVLYPAIAYVHKNHAVLLDAMSRLPELDLVLTGGPGPCDDEVRRRAARPDLSGRVHVLGRVDRSDLAALTAGARLVAVPSRYEGFGLPALEAVVAGRPLVVADAGSLPEVADGAALVVPPDDVAGWADALHTAATDDAVRSRLVAAGVAVTASCTPERTGTALVDVWSRALRGLPAGHTTANPSERLP
ncbi:MAG: glycosyltransferase family 1 protein [Acidimicrobiales bacterium]